MERGPTAANRGAFFIHCCLQIVSGHHPGDVTAMFAPDLQFFDLYPFFGCQNAEALQKIWNLEKFWGFRTRTAPAGGGAVPFRRRGRTG